MERYSTEVGNFLKNQILPKLEFDNYIEDNIGEIVKYLFSEIEGPLCEAGDILNDSDKELLRLATTAINEITTRSDWK